MNRKILSVVVPVYNMQDYLYRCLDSLLISNQEFFQALEVIVVNDGSTDGSLRIARDYETRYPSVFRIINKTNGNCGSCINAALAVATGKYFRQLDADDWFDTEALTAFVGLLRDRNEDIVSTPKTIHYSDGRILAFKASSVDYGQTYLIDDLHLKGSLEKGLITMQALSFRTDFLRNIGHRQQEGIFYTDLEYCYFPMKGARDIYFSDLYVYQYLIGREGQSVSFKNMVKNKHHHFLVAKRLMSDLIAIQGSISDNRRRILLNELYPAVIAVYRDSLLYTKPDSDLLELDQLVRQQYVMNQAVEKLTYKNVPYVKLWRELHIDLHFLLFI